MERPGAGEEALLASFFTVVVRLRVVGFFFVSERLAEPREDEPDELPPSSLANRDRKSTRLNSSHS